MKDKMIYVMNVDWNWIKQRPHFFAEILSKDYNITIVYQYLYRRKGLQKRSNGNFRTCPLYLIPKIDRFSVLKGINVYLKNFLIKIKIIREKPKFLYLTYPDQYGAIPSNFEGIIIYDCMDNHSAVIKNEKDKKKIEKKELNILKRSNLVIVSSEKLKELLISRYGKGFYSKIKIVRNGYDGNMVETEVVNKKTPYFTITYFGTIGSWFNFNFVERSLEEIEGLKYKIIGPIADVIVPDNKKIDYIGTIEHDKLHSITKNDDCLIMPFIVNELIEAVDPVKLYEYINMDKNIICVEYDEIRRFEPFVYFYSDYDSFINVIKMLMIKNEKKYTQKSRTEFLAMNTWEHRVDRMTELIKEFEESGRSEK